jgi:hypothetical protein
MELFHKRTDVVTRWSTFENRDLLKGQGGREGDGAKGHAFDTVPAGQAVTLLDVAGPGVVRRMWITFEITEYWLRNMRIEMFWDHGDTPAVSMPIADFAGMHFGKLVPFESELFASPEGRSFLSFVPMPFNTHARIQVVNDAEQDLPLFFYDIALELGPHRDEILYFHATRQQAHPNALREDHVILPRVHGAGRLLATSVSLETDPRYGESWWGEGEVKVYLDGDNEFPTLVGTGSEDYPGSAWGIGPFSNRFQGCPIGDKDTRQWNFYRQHIPDPVHFTTDCKVTIQCMGGARRHELKAFAAAGAPVWPVLCDDNGKLIPAEESIPSLAENDESWLNFYRTDHYTSTAYYYLDRP